jgi:hypothetical protein
VRVDGRSWAFSGDVSADSLAYVGRVEIPPGTVRVDVLLSHPDLGEVVNSYGGLLLGTVVISDGRPGGGCGISP